jgi:hypothetical protein
MSRNRRIGAVVLAAIAAAAAGLLLLREDDDDPRASGASGLDGAAAPDGVDPVLSGLGEEVVALLAGRTALTYHATYEASGDEDAIGGAVTIEEFRAGPDRVRSDTRTEGAEGTAETRTIVDDDEVVSCARTGDEAFTCTQQSAAGTAPILGTVEDQLAGVSLTETDTTEVGGRVARCFAFTAEEGPGELCIDDRGIPLRIVVGDLELVLTALEDEVPGDAFDPPADPVPAEAIVDEPPVDEVPAEG